MEDFEKFKKSMPKKFAPMAMYKVAALLFDRYYLGQNQLFEYLRIKKILKEEPFKNLPYSQYLKHFFLKSIRVKGRGPVLKTHVRPSGLRLIIKILEKDRVKHGLAGNKAIDKKIAEIDKQHKKIIDASIKDIKGDPIMKRRIDVMLKKLIDWKANQPKTFEIVKMSDNITMFSISDENGSLAIRQGIDKPILVSPNDVTSYLLPYLENYYGNEDNMQENPEPEQDTQTEIDLDNDVKPKTLSPYEKNLEMLRNLYEFKNVNRIIGFLGEITIGAKTTIVKKKGYGGVYKILFNPDADCSRDKVLAADLKTKKIFGDEHVKVQRDKTSIFLIRTKA